MSEVEVARGVVTIVPSMEGAQKAITTELSSATSGVSDIGQVTGSKFSSGLSKGLAVAGVATAAITAVTAKTTQAFVGAANEVAEYGDNIDKMSQKMGISAESYQEWDFVMEHCGTSMETLKASMKTMANAAENGNDAFQQLGITQEQVANMSQEDLFAATIEGLQGVEDTTQRTYLAGQLLGRGATELGALMNMSAEDTEAMKEQLHELGGVMSNDAVLAAAGFEDALLNMETAADGVKNNLMANFLPGMSEVMNGLAAVFSGDESGMDSVTAGIESILEKVTELLPGFIEMGGKIIIALIEGIVPMLPQIVAAVIEGFVALIAALVEALPDLIPVVVEGIGVIVTAIFDNLPRIIESALELLMSFVNKLSDPGSLAKLVETAVLIITTVASALVEALPMIVEAGITLVAQLVETLIGKLSDLVSTGLQFVSSIVSGIGSGIPDIVKGAKSIVTNILDTLSSLPKQLISMALSWGRDLIDNFVRGIMDNISKVTSAVSDVAGTVKDYIGFSEPDKGPLSDFHTYAPDMIDLFTTGLNDSRAKINGTMESVLSMPEQSIGAGAGGGSITIPVYLGDEILDSVIVNSQQRVALRSGGVA